MASRPAYFERLLKLLRRKGRSREDAEDLIQEAMLRLHVYGRDAPVVNEEAFVRHAAHNLAIDQHRRDRLDLRREVPIDDVEAQTPLVAAQATPEETIEAQQRLNQIAAVLEAVSPRTREICSLISTIAMRATLSWITSGTYPSMIRSRNETRSESRAWWIRLSRSTL
jgi:RNA polymerase sigma factor (sigma-70 family)